MKELTATIAFDIRFSEVDSMNVVWHGSYPLYFVHEDIPQRILCPAGRTEFPV